MNKRGFIFGLIIVFLTACSSGGGGSSPPPTPTPAPIPTPSLSEQAFTKIQQLEALVATAEEAQIDTTREESILWFANEFLKYAQWDEENSSNIEFFFENYYPYRNRSVEFARDLPDFERQQVLNILNKGISNLTLVIDGSIQRRPVAKVDWENITTEEDMFVSNGKPSFLYDYFSKSMGIPTSDEDVYNDHLGNIDHLPSVNPNFLNSENSFQNWRLTEIDNHPSTKVGYSLLWNSGIPNWMAAQEPEIAVGRSLFTGFDIDNPLSQSVWGTILREVGERTRGHKSITMGVILSNEPHWYSEEGHWTQQYGEMNSISSYTLNKFRDWLETTYDENIATLNQNWGSNFANFSAVTIDIPISTSTRGQPIWYDWCRFNMDRATQWFTFLQSELHAVNPDADTSIKIMTDLFTENNRSHGIDLEALTELTTMIGDDAKTRGRSLRSTQAEEWEAHYSYFWEELAVAYDFMESVSPNKIHVNSETHFLSSSWWRDLNTSPEYVRNTFWLATVMGMDAGLSWFWARDPDGSPEDRLEGDLQFSDPALAGSFAASVVMQPQVANELTQVMMDLNSYSEEIMALRKQRRPIRIFYSETSAINKTAHMTAQFELYESLFFEGFPVGYATQKIIQKQDNDLWDVIVIHETEFVTDAEFNALQAYLNNGGTVVMDSTSLSKNEYGQDREINLTNNQSRLIRVNGNVAALKEAALEVAVNPSAGIVLNESNGLSHKGCTWRVTEKEGGGYLMTIINIGANTATLSISNEGDDTLNATDLLTGELLGAEFNLESNGVLLLDLSVVQ